MKFQMYTKPVVEKLWMTRAFPVDGSPAQIFFAAGYSETVRIAAVRALSSGASLDLRGQPHTIWSLPIRQASTSKQ